jgi:hypothetical protein
MNAAFPLTPTLSLGERGYRPQRLALSDASQFLPTRGSTFPFPEGEDQGEGERVRQTGCLEVGQRRLLPMNPVGTDGLPKPRHPFPQKGYSLRETRTTPSLTLFRDRRILEALHEPERRTPMRCEDQSP